MRFRLPTAIPLANFKVEERLHSGQIPPKQVKQSKHDERKKRQVGTRTLSTFEARSEAVGVTRISHKTAATPDRVDPWTS